MYDCTPARHVAQLIWAAILGSSHAAQREMCFLGLLCYSPRVERTRYKNIPSRSSYRIWQLLLTNRLPADFHPWQATLCLHEYHFAVIIHWRLTSITHPDPPRWLRGSTMRYTCTPVFVFLCTSTPGDCPTKSTPFTKTNQPSESLRSVCTRRLNRA